MLRKILSLIFNCENTTTVETVSISRPRVVGETLATPETRTEQSGRIFYSPGNEVEIPDPWDDPLM